jgi:predicted DNA-binding ribbon-helix-helix protein
MKSPVIKHSIMLNGHKTSVSLEDQFWDGLREIAARDNVAVSTLVERIDLGRSGNNLSSAIRVFVLAHFRVRVGQQGLPGGRPDQDVSTAPTIAPGLEAVVFRS